MLRLLYLLARQALLRRRPVTSSGLLAPMSARGGRNRAIGIVALCVVALGVLIYPRHRSARLMQASVENAALELRIDAISSTPLVIFLETAERTTAPVDRLTASATSAAPSATARIASVNSTFEPAFQVAPIAASIEVSNQDAIAHNTHVFDGQRTLFNVALPRSGVHVHKLLGRVGIFDVRCDLHAWMRAWIFVPPANSHHAVIRQPGKVTLSNVAPGDYQLHTWTPAEGESTQALSLGTGEIKALRLAIP
jgi:plastocyanin